MFKFILNKWKEEWWQNHEDELLQSFAYREQTLKTELEEHLDKNKQSFKKTLSDSPNKSELTQAWMNGFSEGVSKSFDLLAPNIEHLRKKAYEDAFNNSLKLINGKR